MVVCTRASDAQPDPFEIKQSTQPVQNLCLGFCDADTALGYSSYPAIDGWDIGTAEPGISLFTRGVPLTAAQLTSI